ncbi:MAG: GNAT family N-acetyltransferase [Pseudomonadota bacterium]
MTHALQTERLVFRRFMRSDAARLAELLNDIDIARWISPMPHPYTRQDADTFLDAVVGEKAAPYALEHEGHLAGSIAVGRMLGFWLTKPLWNRGLITEAARALLTDHFRGGAEEVQSGFHDGNVASQRVHAKLGFVPNGQSKVFSKALAKEVIRHDLLLKKDRWEQAA